MQPPKKAKYKKIENTLIQSLNSTAKDFRKDELAFLALTTKIELPLRDRWASMLYKGLAKQKLIVSREWKRVDLAILKESRPVVLVELKAMYTFDVVNGGVSGKKLVGCLKQDMKNAENLANRSTSIYGVLLVTHPKEIIPNNLVGVVKYQSRINSAFKSFGKQKEIAKIASERTENLLRKSKILEKGTLQGGSAFGIKTDVLYWIVKGEIKYK